MSRKMTQFSIRSLIVAMFVGALVVHFFPRRSQDSQDPKWREFLFKDAAPLANVPVVTPKLTVGDSARVVVRNVGGTTLEYYAAGAEHVQAFRELDVEGRWTLAGWDWCGTGKEIFEIPPKQSVELVVYFSGGQERERILANFSEKSTNRSGLVVLATESAN